MVQLFLGAENVVGVDADIRGLTLGPSAGLVDHNLTVGQGEPLARGSCSKQKSTHAGYKLGQWWDILWMELPLGERSAPPEPFRPFPSLERETVKKVLEQAKKALN